MIENSNPDLCRIAVLAAKKALQRRQNQMPLDGLSHRAYRSVHEASQHHPNRPR